MRNKLRQFFEPKNIMSMLLKVLIVIDSFYLFGLATQVTIIAAFGGIVLLIPALFVLFPPSIKNESLSRHRDLIGFCLAAIPSAIIYLWPYSYVTAVQESGSDYRWLFSIVIQFRIAAVVLIMLVSLHYFAVKLGLWKTLFLMCVGIVLIGYVPFQTMQDKANIMNVELTKKKTELAQKYQRKELYLLTRTYAPVRTVTLGQLRWPSDNNNAAVWSEAYVPSLDYDDNSDIRVFKVLKVNGQPVPKGFEIMMTGSTNVKVEDYPALVNFLKRTKINYLDQTDIDEHKFDTHDQDKIDALKVTVVKLNETVSFDPDFDEEG